MNYIKKIFERIKKEQRLLIFLLIIIIVFVGFNFVSNKLVAHSFFNKYSVLTASGESMFRSDKILLDGSIVERDKEEWTNILPVPDSLKYILMTSSYSKGHDIKCGDNTIAKRVESSNMGENEWCIKHNGKNYVAISAAQYYYYDAENIVYEKCLKSGYYEGAVQGRGYNSCAIRGLFLNDKQIATTTERFGIDYNTKEKRIGDAPSFNYLPSKRLADVIIYSTSEGTYSYNMNTEKTVRVSDNEVARVDDVFLTKDKKTIVVEEDKNMTEGISAFLSKVSYDDKTYTNVYSSNYLDGHFYILRLSEVRNEDDASGKIITYELLRDGQKIENIEIGSISPFGYNSNAVQKFPLCDVTGTIVCVYEDGHYAYKNRVLAPEVFGYNFYTEEMVIDGEWRGDNIPNWIGSSKPIFEEGKLKYIVFAGFPDGLYLVDMDKKWNFKDLYNKRGSATTKLLSGNQNRLLNVIEK